MALTWVNATDNLDKRATRNGRSRQSQKPVPAKFQSLSINRLTQIRLEELNKIAAVMNVKWLETSVNKSTNLHCPLSIVHSGYLQINSGAVTVTNSHYDWTLSFSSLDFLIQSNPSVPNPLI